MRAGLIGYGTMGKNHARVLSDEPEFEFLGVYDPIFPLNASNTVQNFQSLHDLLAKELDYCVISVPTSHHAEIFEQIADSVKCVLVEKPIASSSAEASLMISIAEENGTLAAVGHIERFNPAVQLMRRMIEDDIIGELIQITTRRQGPFPQRIQDVGVVKDLATHDIDITRFVSSSEYADVTAFTRKLTDSRHEDLLSATGLLKSGVIFSHLVNWRYPIKERVVSALGTKGALVADLLTSDLTFYENGVEPISWGQMSLLRGNSEGSSVKFAVNKIEPLRLEHRAMAEYFSSGNSKIVVNLTQGRENLLVAERMLNNAIVEVN